MPKTVSSPVKRWPGSVTIADPLTFPQVQEIERVLNYTVPEEEIKDGMVHLTVTDVELLQAVKACVEKWELADFTPDPFPASPRVASHKLIEWIFKEILIVYNGEQESPNA